MEGYARSRPTRVCAVGGPRADVGQWAPSEAGDRGVDAKLGRERKDFHGKIDPPWPA